MEPDMNGRRLSSWLSSINIRQFTQFLLNMTEGSVSQIKAKVKVVFLGDQSTGKTSLITRFINNRFEPDIGPTVGIDFLAKNISINNYVVRLQLWDTAGQQRFRSLIPNYLKDALVALLVFDLSNRKTFENLAEWIELYSENRNEKATLFLVGNKVDLPVREVSQEEAENKAKELGVQYFQTSAKTSVNIQKMFFEVAKSFVKEEKQSLMNSTVKSKIPDPLPMPPPSQKAQTPAVRLFENNLPQDRSRKAGCCG